MTRKEDYDLHQRFFKEKQLFLLFLIKNWYKDAIKLKKQIFWNYSITLFKLILVILILMGNDFYQFFLKKIVLFFSRCISHPLLHISGVMWYATVLHGVISQSIYWDWTHRYMEGCLTSATRYVNQFRFVSQCQLLQRLSLTSVYKDEILSLCDQ